MSWLERFVRPRIRTLMGRPQPEEASWPQCPACNHVTAPGALEAALHVCPHCRHHMRLSAPQRLRATLDPGWQVLDLPQAPHDPLQFRDQKRYAERLREARTRTGQEDALLAAEGAILGQAAVVAAMDFTFMGGSMGVGVGNGLVAAAKHAAHIAAPMVVFAASGGARMQEGALSLMQMPRSIVAREILRDARLPFIVVFTDPTTGGVTASFAMLGDVHLAEPNALIGFAGARVIEQTVRETLPEGFQRAEYLHAHGLVDQIVPRSEMRRTLALLLALLTAGRATAGEEEPLTW